MLQKRELIQSNNVVNKSLNFGGDITSYGVTHERNSEATA